MTANIDMWRGFGRAAALNPAQRHRWRLLAEAARRSVQAANPVIVDLGCGSGQLLAAIARALPGSRRVGIDRSRDALALAQANDPQAQWLLADLESAAAVAGAPVGSSALVLCSEVLEHLDAPERTVALARGLLAPGGRFLVTVPAGAITPFDRAIGHRRHYSLGSLAELLGRGGFALEHGFHWGFPFHSLFRAAMSACPGAATLYRDDRLSAPARWAWEALYWLFFLNARHARLGRQLLAVARAA
jgi:SAM-dependent methyltransferase